MAIRKITGWKKILLFGLLGALGCLVGWLVGEFWLAAVLPPQPDEETATPAIVFSPELNRRLEREGAKTGDVQLSLMWNNYNDLDLHCIDPNGEEIFFRNKRSRSGGELDVDMNAGGRKSNQPVENIYWPRGGAPPGHYRVFVNHFTNHGDPDPTNFTVGVLVAGKSQEFTGALSSGEPKRLIDEFDVAAAQEQQSQPERFWQGVLAIGLWTALLAIGLSLALVMGQNRYLHRPLLSRSQGGILAGGGLMAGLVAGGTAQALLSWVAQVELLVQVGWIAGWALLGGLLGRGMGWFVPNLKVQRSQVAGAVGGFLGALAFLLVSQGAGDAAGRFAGAGILGFSLGLMVILTEQVFREAWLEVRYAPHEIRSINLGVEAVTLGGDPKQCTVYIPDAPPIALRFWLDRGRVLCEDVPAQAIQEIQLGEQRNLGRVAVSVCAAGIAKEMPLQVTVREQEAAISSESRLSLALGERDIPLCEDTQFWQGDIPGLEPKTAGQPVARVNRNPKNPSLLGLQNLSTQPWSATKTDGTRLAVEPGRSLKLAREIQVNFGSVTGEIR